MAEAVTATASGPGIDFLRLLFTKSVVFGHPFLKLTIWSLTAILPTLLGFLVCYLTRYTIKGQFVALVFIQLVGCLGLLPQRRVSISPRVRRV